MHINKFFTNKISRENQNSIQDIGVELVGGGMGVVPLAELLRGGGKFPPLRLGNPTIINKS